MIRVRRPSPVMVNLRRKNVWPGMGGRRGLGYDYYDVLAEAGGLRSCDPHDSACVARNTQVQAAAEDIWVANMNNATAGQRMPSFTVTPDLSVVGSPTSPFFMNAPPNPTVTFSGQAPTTLAHLEGSRASATPAAQGARGGQLSFSTSRGGTSLQVGDTWTIRITGATPGSPVTVVGGKNGARDSNVMGSTDGSGNFSLSGTLTADQVGTWSESWSVGGASSGSFSFTVAAGAPATTPDGKVIINSGGVQQTASSSAASSFDFSSIPWWGWAAAGVAALVVLKGGK
jgi:hypothetical protein